MENPHNMLEYEQLTGVFSKIIANPEDAKQALSDPSSVLAKYGIEVSDPEATNKILFEVAPQLRAHFLAAARGKPHENALLGCDSPGCIACNSGLAISLAAVIAGGIAFAGPIAAMTGLAITVVMGIIDIRDGTPPSPSNIVRRLCQAMGAC
jgi:hypothetical protein